MNDNLDFDMPFEDFKASILSVEEYTDEEFNAVKDNMDLVDRRRMTSDQLAGVMISGKDDAINTSMKSRTEKMVAKFANQKCDPREVDALSHGMMLAIHLMTASSYMFIACGMAQSMMIGGVRRGIITEEGYNILRSLIVGFSNMGDDALGTGKTIDMMLALSFADIDQPKDATIQ